MKQLDFETSNYKYKEAIKTFIQSFNEMADKYVKSYDNREADLKRVTTAIEKKNCSIEKLNLALADLAKKTDEFKALKEMSNAEITNLNAKKSEVSYTDSEVQKMELDDLNSQIAQKRSKIAKIDVKMDAIKAKIKADNEEKKTYEKELRDLDKERYQEEEALFRTEGLLALVTDIKDTFNSRALEIVNAPYRPIKNEPETTNEMDETTVEEPVIVPNNEPKRTINISQPVELKNNKPIMDAYPVNEPIKEPVFQNILPQNGEEKTIVEPVSLETVADDSLKAKVSLDIVDTPTNSPMVEDKPNEEMDSLLLDVFKKEGIDINSFSDEVKAIMNENKDLVMKNMEILLKHNVPLEYTVDQPEIYYNISNQDLDDLLSIITTDDDGNGMGFSIDFTYNILTELSQINVDKLIDVYNSEFMNVNSKSGIIGLLKMTNSELGDFSKNRAANISILREFGANTVDEIIERYPDFVNMDNPLFLSILNVFDKNDLVEKLNADVDVVPKIIEYWKNN